MTLSELLTIRPGITALIGGGGKTTAMYTLARELSPRGTVICTTTTRIYPPDHLPILDGKNRAKLAAALERYGCICVGMPAQNGKLAAPPLPPCQLLDLADFVLVEADGSKGLPLKAHLSHEPVIPEFSEMVLTLAGASGFGRPVQEAVHRWEQFCQLTGADPAGPVTAENFSRLLLAEDLEDKVFINQAENAGDMAEARRLAALLPKPVYAGSLQGGFWTCLS